MHFGLGEEMLSLRDQPQAICDAPRWSTQSGGNAQLLPGGFPELRQVQCRCIGLVQAGIFAEAIELFW